MIVKIWTHLYLEKWENFWKNQGILSVKKSGNPDMINSGLTSATYHMAITSDIKTTYQLIIQWFNIYQKIRVGQQSYKKNWPHSKL